MQYGKGVYYEKYVRNKSLQKVQDGETADRVSQKKRLRKRNKNALQELYEEEPPRQIPQQGRKRTSG